jgi:geranylgeranyl transferase type-2 subunit alpha
MSADGVARSGGAEGHRAAGAWPRLLQLDQRNFQGWGYRRFVAARAGVAPDVEDDYAQECINANFSNYSAWHARAHSLQPWHDGVS